MSQWKNSTRKHSGPFCLLDFLYEDVPGARIVTYLMVTKLSPALVLPDVLELAQPLLLSLKSVRINQTRRPIIFVAHGLGGIAGKQAPVEARETSDLTYSLNRITGTLVFGTSHRGARGCPDLSITLGELADAASKVAFSPSTSVNAVSLSTTYVPY